MSNTKDTSSALNMNIYYSNVDTQFWMANRASVRPNVANMNMPNSTLRYAAELCVKNKPVSKND